MTTHENGDQTVSEMTRTKPDRIEQLFEEMTREADLALEAKRDAAAATKQLRLEDAAHSLIDAAIHQRVAQILHRVLRGEPAEAAR